MVGKDGVIQVDAVLSPIYRIQFVFRIHTAGLLVASTRANPVQIQTLDALRKHVGPLVQWDKEVLEDLVDVVPIRVLDCGGGKLDNELVNQGPRHVLDQIVVGVRSGNFEVDVEHERKRARDDDLVLRKLGSSMLEGVHSQPNFSPPNKRITKKTQIFQTFPQNFKLFYPSILTQPDMFVLT